MKFTEEVLQAAGPRWPIPSVLCLPEHEKPLACVVMLHGTASSRDEIGGGYRIMAAELAQRGIASIRFDLPGCGDSPVDFSEYSISAALSDARAVVGYIRGLPCIDKARIGVLGWSQGGMLSILLAADDPQIRSLAVWASALKMEDVWAEYRNEALEKGVVTVELNWRSPINVSAKWFEEAAVVDAMDALCNVRADILAICGSDDHLGLQPNLDIVMKNARSKRKETWLMEGADHIFRVFEQDKPHFKDIVRRTADWFSETLQRIV